MKFRSILSECLSEQQCDRLLYLIRRWKGARVYIPREVPSSDPHPIDAAAAFATDLRTAFREVGSDAYEADLVLTAFSGGYVWI